MKAEERKQIETNSLVLAVQKGKQYLSGRPLYYIVGTLVLVTVGIVLYRYFASERKKARDAVQFQLMNADTPEKLKQGMEDHRGTIDGSLFKLNLARHLLKNEGLPKLGTDRTEARRLAANSVSDARAYFLELTGELKEKEQAALLQEAWLSAAKAEESLVGLPNTEGGTDSRGDVDKAAEYYEKAAAIFSDKDFSKSYKERADKLKATKTQFIADQKSLYKPREFPFSPPGKDPFGKDPFGPIGLPPLPGGAKLDPNPLVIPPPPPMPPPSEALKPEPKPSVPPKIELPAVPKLPESDPKKTDPPKVDSKAK